VPADSAVADHAHQKWEMLSRVAVYDPKCLTISIAKVTSAVSNGASPKTNVTVRR